MRMLLNTRLAAMMFLQYAIWGAWAPILGQDLTSMGFSGIQIGWIYSALPLACMIGPFVGGQFVDRYVPTQYFLGFAHLAGALFLWLLAGSSQFPGMLLIVLIWSLLFAPTLALTNSICFTHLKNSDKSFPLIRTLGTIGWIVAGHLLTLWRHNPGILPLSGRIDSLVLAAFFSLILGLFCFSLPHTPPNKEAKNPWAFLEALRLFRSPQMAFFLVLCMVASSEFQFYYVLSSPFLNDIGITAAEIPRIMTIAQAAEILTLAVALPLLLPRLGVRWCILIGLLAWPVRYLIFALREPVWLVVSSLSLHGLGFAFFFIVAFMYVDRVAPKDIRGSAQALVTFATYGLGLFLGSLFCGYVKDFFTEAGVTNWTAIFLVPALITAACAVAHFIWFREANSENPPA
jgi:nucleoside transporter